jgi:hypothetical protein
LSSLVKEMVLSDINLFRKEILYRDNEKWYIKQVL